MHYVLFDDPTRLKLLPFTFTRPVADIRLGIFTIREKWEHVLGAKTSTLTEAYLSIKYPYLLSEDTLFINGSVCPNKDLVDSIKTLKPSQALVDKGCVLAVRVLGKVPLELPDAIKEHVATHVPYLKLNNLWDIFSKNDEALRADFQLITEGRKSQAISTSNKVMGEENIFIEPGAKVECAVLNASTGPIYIGKNAEVMEGSLVRGPFSLGEHSVLKLGAKIYGATTIGPHSKVGGEVSNSVIFGYSNKAHDGFLGNSVVGEWCNLGADTNTSNLKNNYSEVQLWDYTAKSYGNTGLTFCGLMMGDHSKCGINTMFNTGTVVGVNANIFGAGFPDKHIPSFAWGGADGFVTYKLEQAFYVAQNVFDRRHIEFSEEEQKMLSHVFELTRPDRIW